MFLVPDEPFQRVVECPPMSLVLFIWITLAIRQPQCRLLPQRLNIVGGSHHVVCKESLARVCLVLHTFSGDEFAGHAHDAFAAALTHSRLALTHG